MYHIQEFMRPCTFEEPNGNSSILSAIINPRFPAAINWSVPECESYILSRSKKLLINANKVKPLAEKEGALSCDKIEVGDFVSTDQFVCKNPGRLPTGYGRESQDFSFKGGNLYNDYASILI